MMQLKNGDLSGLEPDRRRKLPVKVEVEVEVEVEDSSDESSCGFSNKRVKRWSPEYGAAKMAQPAQPAHYSPLDEPSPLGLRLRKSPSLLDLIQMKLSKGFSGVSANENHDFAKKKDGKGSISSVNNSDKLKASNFPASLLRIGTWECVSKYEGDLVAKCYFAKHKLVWEILDGPLKSKIEIQWSDITDIKASFPDDKPGTLDIVLARQPFFFRETNPQPRKHTLWQTTADFTGDQATKHRRHHLQCPPGILNKHFEKLIQCDPRLNLLSCQAETILESPFFEIKESDTTENFKCRGYDQIKKEVPTFAGFHDQASTSPIKPSTPVATEIQDQAVFREVATTSGLDFQNAESKKVVQFEDVKENADSSRWDNAKMPGLRPSISMSDLMTHIGQCISEQMTTGNPFFAPEGEGGCSKDMLEEINQYLLSDSQLPPSDEKSLMTRVESLCCLLQKDAATVQNLQIMNEDGTYKHQDLLSNVYEEEKKIGGEPLTSNCEFSLDGWDYNQQQSPTYFDGSGYKLQQPQAMSRKDSIGDLLLHLPRIASLPQFLYNIAEDHDNQAR